MATEAIDARHEAMLCLHRAILEIEQSDLHEAARLAHAAIAWMRDVLPEPSLEPVKEIIWEYPR